MYLGASPVAVDKVAKSTTELSSLYSSTGAVVSSASASRSAPEPSRHSSVAQSSGAPPPPDRYPPVAALAGEQLLARSGFQPYRPDDRYV